MSLQQHLAIFIMQPAEFTVPAQVAIFDIATEFVNLLQATGGAASSADNPSRAAVRATCFAAILQLSPRGCP